MTAPHKVLVIDDDDHIGEIISTAARSMGFACEHTSDAPAFLAALTPDTSLILLDLLMPKVDGVQLLRLLGQQQCRVNIVLMSGIGKRVIETAEQLGAAHGLSIVGHLHKPFRLRELEGLLQAHTTAELAIPLPLPPQTFAPPDIDLKHAIEADQFVVHFQPEIDINSRHVVGLEALVRWKHPQHGLIAPDEFITRLEGLGLIDQLGWIVAHQALSQFAQFADHHGALPTLSLNVSTYSLRNLEFPDVFLSLTSKYGIPPDRIILEITESGLIKELASSLDVLTRLRLKQVQLAIDDFGTGFSMMRQLRTIPATELKIDRSFVQHLQASETDRNMVRKTIEMGHALGLKVIAEGVETLWQLDFLRAHHCDLAQGHLFSSALPAKELLLWLKRHREEVALPTPFV